MSSKRFPTLDPSSFQGSRYFMVNPDAQVFIHDKWRSATAQPGDAAEDLEFLDPYESEMLPKSLKRTKKSRPLKSQSYETNREELYEKNKHLYYIPELVVTTSKNEEVFVQDIRDKTQVICPFCDPAKRQHPDKHNAFVDFNKAGQQFLHCTSEHMTYWADITPGSLDVTKASVIWEEVIGSPAELTKDGRFNVFKSDADFINYAHANNINPDCRLFLPRVRLTFDPKLKPGISGKTINIFNESYLLKKDRSDQEKYPLHKWLDSAKIIKEKTPVIYEILYNILGSDHYLNVFINWNAFILRRRLRPTTAFLITTETQGTGKDLTFGHILQPLYGEDQCQLLDAADMDNRFNGLDLNCWLRGYNEIAIKGDVAHNNQRKEQMKNKITAKKATVEFKGKDKLYMLNQVVYILFSNNRHPIFLDKMDRRFNVIRNDNAKQVKELSFYKGQEYIESQIAAEIETFADIVLTTDDDYDVANTPVETEVKAEIQDASTEEEVRFAEALEKHNVEYFLLQDIKEFQPSAQEKMFNPDQLLNSEGIECEEGIKEGYIRSKHMGYICSRIFTKTPYRRELEKLRYKNVVSTSKRIGATTTSVYVVKKKTTKVKNDTTTAVPAEQSST
jgi:hypothetical protein